MTKIIAFVIFLAASVVGEPIVKPDYTAEEWENLDVSHILHDIFENNGEHVEDYLDLSQFFQTQEPEEPEMPDNFDIFAEQLPGDLLSAVSNLLV